MKKKLDEYSDSELFYMLTEEKRTAEKAFAELYSRLSPRIYAYCRRFLANKEEAQDIFQETFAKFFESAFEKRDMTNVPAFILRIARNLCVNLKRKESTTLISIEDYMAVAPSSSSEQDEMLELIKSAIELLPDEYRDMFILREYDGLSYQEIADVTGESISTVKIRLYRAKQKVRSILQPYLEEANNYK